MSWNSVFKIHKAYLHCISSGLLEYPEQLQRLNATIAQTVKKTGLRRVLLDMRKCESVLDFHDILTAENSKTSDKLSMAGARIAAFVKPHRLKDHQMYETMAINRSIIYRAFSDKAKALDWLTA